MESVKNYTTKILLLIVIILSGISLVSCTTDTDDIIDEETTIVSLSQEEKDMLIRMREEEKLARDVYDYLYTKYDTLVIFDNISNSEQTHMNQILTLLIQFNIPDPALPEAGKFSNPVLQDLYDQLTAAGEVSEVEALKIGATIEDLDIYDLEEYATQTENMDILTVFARLTCGSRNHMRGFVSQLNLYNETYTPQFISESEFDAIVESSHESCY